MPMRPAIRQAAIFAIGFAAGSAFIFPTIHLMRAASSGDQLNFLGAMLGAGFTVAGSVTAVAAIERGKLRRERAGRRVLLLELIADVLKSVDRVEETLAKKEGTLGVVAAATENLNRKIKVLKDARQWIVPDNAAMVRGFGYIGALNPVMQYSGTISEDQRASAVEKVRGELDVARTWSRSAWRELQS